MWQADLVDMSHLVEENDGYRYLLTVIDVFSKQAWVKKLKKKDGKSVTDAFDEISKTRRAFDKGYLPNWTEEIFTVTEVIDTKPRTYKLEDYGHEKIEGSFYEKEIQQVVKTDDVFKIEKVLSTRKRKGVKEYFVKWKGYPEKFNSWIGESDLTTSI